jgi:hypothetical protein
MSVIVMDTDVRMLRGQEAQEQPAATGMYLCAVLKIRLRREALRAMDLRAEPAKHRRPAVTILSQNVHKLQRPTSDPLFTLPTAMPELLGLFPTPFMRAQAAFGTELVDGLVQHFSGSADTANNASRNLVHTAMLKPSDSPLLIEAAHVLTPLLAEFGAVMFGERLGWSLKEMWLNVLDKGGQQAMHNHANSFISGVVYLTRMHPQSRTVFMKSIGSDFSFKNDHQGVTTGPYNADKWISPQPEPGDAVLFPSYLLHAVPTNPGERRITLSFNAIPTRLDSWGYKISFSG